MLTPDFSKPNITNIVSTVDLNCDLKLNEISSKITNSTYNQKFKRIEIRIKEPKSIVFIYSKGKLICLGAKSIEDSEKTARKYCNEIKSLGYNTKFNDFKIVNIVATCDVKFSILLNKLNEKEYQKLKTNEINLNYEPTVYPGLIIHMKKPEVTLTIFGSGKINFTGAKNPEDIKKALELLYPLIYKYKNKTNIKNN
jgi:transcription initiation factor TFIID TATA-box-binding protein